MHFWLHNTAQCTVNIVYGHLHGGFTLAERVGQGEMGEVIRKVVCTGIGFAVKEPWLALSGPILAYCLNRLTNATLTL